MNSLKVLQWSISLFLGYVLAAPCWADNCSGRVNGVALFGDTIEVGKGHTMTVFESNNITTSDNSPNNAAGKCGGYAITTPDGKTRVVGVCGTQNKGWR